LISTRRVAWPLLLVLVVWQTKCKMVRGQTVWSADKAHPAEEAEDVLDENCSPLIDEFERWMALEDPSAREISFHLVRVNTKLVHKGCRPVGKPGKSADGRWLRPKMKPQATHQEDAMGNNFLRGRRSRSNIRWRSPRTQGTGSTVRSPSRYPVLQNQRTVTGTPLHHPSSHPRASHAKGSHLKDPPGRGAHMRGPRPSREDSTE